MDKFKFFNKIKINIDKYEEIETHNNEELKIKMLEKLNTSNRSKRKMKIQNRLIGSIAGIGIIVVGIGVMSPSLAENLKIRLPEFRTMLDKVRDAIYTDGTVEYDPSLYPELEEEKKEYKKNKLIATPINVTSEGDGLKITIDKGVYDKKKIYLDMTLHTEKPFNKSKYKKTVGDSPYGDGVKQMDIELFDIYINGSKADNYSYSSGIVDFIDERTVNLSYMIELDPINNIEDANFKIIFGIRNYGRGINIIGEKHAFEFNIKSIDDSIHNINLNEKDGEYTIKKLNVTQTYVEIEMELPFQPSLGNPHNNFIIVHDDKGRELPMTTGIDRNDKMYTQINELINVGEIPKYIDILVCTNYGEEDNPISHFRVNLD